MDANHTDYVMVRNKKWGGELETFAALLAAASMYIPVVAVIVGGDLSTDRLVRGRLLGVPEEWALHTTDSFTTRAAVHPQIKLLAHRHVRMVALKGTGGSANKVSERAIAGR